jgi:hypothetical protein
MQAAADVPVRCVEQMQHRIQVGDDLRAPTCTPQRCTLGSCTVLCTLTQQGIIPQLPGTTYYLRDCIVIQTRRNAAEVGGGGVRSHLMESCTAGTGHELRCFQGNFKSITRIHSPSCSGSTCRHFSLLANVPEPHVAIIPALLLFFKNAEACWVFLYVFVPPVLTFGYRRFPDQSPHVITATLHLVCASH